MVLRVTVLGSGSSGNSTIIESENSAVLVDAGFSCKELEKRLSVAGTAIDKIRAIVISHEHSDHVKGGVTFSKKHKIPVYMSEGTFEAGGLKLDGAYGVEKFVIGEEFPVDGFNVHPFRIPHDAVDPSAFVVKRGSLKLGIGTDLGYVTSLVENYFRDVDMLIFESNYDPDMLRDGPYPWFLKQRIASRNGHLSNLEAMDYLKSHLGPLTRHLVLGHLSRTNNNPNLVMSHIKDVIEQTGQNTTRVYVADQFECSEQIDLEE